MSRRALAAAIAIGGCLLGCRPAFAQPAVDTLTFAQAWLGPEGPREGAPLIIALHPWGSAGRPMIRLLERGLAPDRAVRVIAPDGILAYEPGRAWLTAAVADADPELLAREAIRSANAVRALIRREAEPSTPVIVVGISQGAVVGYTLAARFPDLAVAVVAAAGLLPDRVQTTERADSTAASTSVTAVHGEQDRFVPFSYARRGLRRLRAAGHDTAMRSRARGSHAIRGPLRRLFLQTIRSRLTAADHRE